MSYKPKPCALKSARVRAKAPAIEGAKALTGVAQKRSHKEREEEREVNREEQESRFSNAVCETQSAPETSAGYGKAKGKSLPINLKADADRVRYKPKPSSQEHENIGVSLAKRIRALITKGTAQRSLPSASTVADELRSIEEQGVASWETIAAAVAWAEANYTDQYCAKIRSKAQIIPAVEKWISKHKQTLPKQISRKKPQAQSASAPITKEKAKARKPKPKPKKSYDEEFEERRRKRLSEDLDFDLL